MGISGLFICCGVLVRGQSPAATLVKIQRVDEATLPETIPEPSIVAFDISPDGSLLAMLVQSMSSDAPQMWLVVEQTKTGTIVKQAQLGPAAAILSDYAPHVRFTRDQKFLVVQDLQRVVVVSTTDYSVMGKIAADPSSPAQVPVSILGAADNDIFAISFGTGQRGQFEVGIDPVHVLIADMSRGKKIADWDASDIPQSISPTGSLIAFSDWNVNDSFLGVQIVDTRTGKKVATLNGGYGFPKTTGYTDAIGEVIGKFVSEDQILLSPNESWDRTGHYAGKSLKVVHIPDGKTVREFTPVNYGPTGEVIVSANRQKFATVSMYISPANAIGRVTLPGAGAELFEFALRETSPELVAKISANGLQANAGGEMLRPSVSSDGSVIAIAQNEGVTVLAKKQQ